MALWPLIGASLQNGCAKSAVSDLVTGSCYDDDVAGATVMPLISILAARSRLAMDQRQRHNLTTTRPRPCYAGLPAVLANMVERV